MTHTWTPLNPKRAPAEAGSGLRVYCLPHAGGPASAYFSWTRSPSSAGLDIWPVELPGHGRRLLEPPLEDMDTLVAAVVDALFSDDHHAPFALFGHSMGALVAYALASRLFTEGGPAPSQVLVSAAPPPGRPPPLDIQGLDDEAVLALMDTLGGTPEELMAARELMELVLPSMRADLNLLADYAPVAARPLPCPIRAYGGVDDPFARPEWIAGWRDFTAGPFSMRTFPGRHFYTRNNEDALLQDIGAQLLDSEIAG